MSATHRYRRRFFSRIQEGSLLSARHIVPPVVRLIRPRSVVDVGCGTGAWLKVFCENGVEDIFGIDGDYVDRSALMIPADRFKPVDLSNPLGLDRRFDLVVSLEVAEHLPASAARLFVDNLVSLGDVILFSAAIPWQGGTHHVNEQWPEYWKALFATRRFQVIDCLRPRFWENREIESWYRQNILLYVHEDRLPSMPDLRSELAACRQLPLAIVHPATFLAPSLSNLLRMFPHVIWRAIRRRLSRD